MAARGSKKELSQRHEQHVADAYNGQRSNSSGGAITDEGDVRVVVDTTLWECKGKFGMLAGDRQVKSGVLTQFEGIADDAYAINYEPALALRFYVPGSFLADNDGWVDLVVRLLDDDVARTDALARYRASQGKEESRCH